jgi:hypothetical protein
MMERNQLSHCAAASRTMRPAPFARAVYGRQTKGFTLHSFEKLNASRALTRRHPRADLLKRMGLAFGFP